MKSSRPRRPSAGPRRRAPSGPCRRCARRSAARRRTARRWPPGIAPRARAAPAARLDPARSAGVGDVFLDGLADALARRGLVVALGEPGAAADHLAQRPEADAFAVGGRTTLVPVDRLRHAVDVLLELPRQAALADARRPGDRDEARPPIAPGRVEQFADQRGTPRRDRRTAARLPARPADPPRWATTRSARQAGTGAALPFSVWSPAGSKAIALRSPRMVASPTRTVPAAATDCRREAVFTRSPATMPWPVAPRVDRRLAGQHAARAWTVLADRPRTASTSSSAARTARSASSSCATGVPQTAITASPMNFSTVPP